MKPATYSPMVSIRGAPSRASDRSEKGCRCLVTWISPPPFTDLVVQVVGDLDRISSHLVPPCGLPPARRVRRDRDCSRRYHPACGLCRPSCRTSQLRG